MYLGEVTHRSQFSEVKKKKENQNKKNISIDNTCQMLQIKQLGKSKLVLHLEKRYYHWQWMYVYVPTEHKSAPNMSREDSSLFRKKNGE